MNPNCSSCGRFCAWDTLEIGVPFGGPESSEPPPEEFYCLACSQRLEEQYVQAGWVPSDWRKPGWAHRAARRLGLHLAGPKGAAWSQFVRTLPDGWEWVP